MTPKANTQSKGNTNHSQAKLITYILIFAFGFLSGVGFTVYKTAPAPQAQTSSDDGHNHDNDDQTQKKILSLEAAVTKTPDNFQLWIELGHLYYDNNMPEKAIVAYTKSLEMHSGDANLLTDLGVMYRRTKQPEKAISLFNQAIEKDPTHLPSRLNKGIVQFYDLGDQAKAFASWDELLAINPDARAGNGQPIRDFVNQLKAETNKQQ